MQYRKVQRIVLGVEGGIAQWIALLLLTQQFFQNFLMLLRFIARIALLRAWTVQRNA